MGLAGEDVAWPATAAQGEYLADPELRALIQRGWDPSISTLIGDFADVLADDPSARLMLRTWLGFNRATGRSWLSAEATREQTALPLNESLHNLMTRVAPALKQLPDCEPAPTGKAERKVISRRSRREE